MPEIFDDLIDCKRILREVCILSQLDHINIVKVLDIPKPPVGDSFTQLMMVMEIADTDMKKLVRTDVTLAPLQINTLLYHLLRGLKYIHSAGIYHRDLKPANCLVYQDCSAKICDFGLARAVTVAKHSKHLGSLPETPPGSDDEDGKKQPERPALARNLTKHVVTRWYPLPSSFCSRRITQRPSTCGRSAAYMQNFLAWWKVLIWRIAAHYFLVPHVFHCRRTINTKLIINITPKAKGS